MNSVKSLKKGDKIEKQFLVDESMVASFVELSGDKNPIHTDKEFARNSQFGRRIVPGILVAGFISSVIANDLPGPGSIYLNQNLNFVKPIFLNDPIKVIITVMDLREDKPIAKLETLCQTSNEVAIEGSAVVKYRKSNSK